MAKEENNKKDNFRGIVRIYSADIKGNYQTLYGISLIKGVKYRLADFVCHTSGIDPAKKIGYLTDDEVSKIESTIKDLKNTLPSWMKNRRKDTETGLDTHLITSDLDYIKDNDIKLMKKIRSYRGVRHMFRLPVRGQRTHSNFRKHKKKIKKK